jgi:hypothetical protein
MDPNPCLLCALDPGDPLAGGLWGLWDPDDCQEISKGRGLGREWVAASNQLLEEAGYRELRPEEFAEHYLEHRPVQPKPPTGTNRGAALYGLEALGETIEAVLIAVFRVQKMTVGQIQEAFYPGKSVNEVDRLLSAAVQGHYLYRYYPTIEDRQRRGMADVLGPIRSDTLYFLGRPGAICVKEKLGLSFEVSSTSGPDQVAKQTLAHDLRAARLAVSLRQALDPDGQGFHFGSYGNEDLLLSFEPSNWLGSTSQGLAMGFWDPYAGREAQIMPDGFVAINVHRSVFGDGALPLFLEYDHGTKERHDVIDQLWAYQALAASGATGARFPQLTDWAVPMLMVFDKPTRLDSIVTEFRKQYGDQGPGAPLLFTSEEQWLEDPLGPIIGNLWAGDKRRPLIEVLVEHSESIIPKLTPGEPLQIDTKAARIRSQHRRANSGKSDDTRGHSSEVEANPTDEPLGPIEDFSHELFDQPEVISTKELVEKIVAARQYLASLEAQYRHLVEQFEPNQVPALPAVQEPEQPAVVPPPSPETKFPEIGAPKRVPVVEPEPVAPAVPTGTELPPQPAVVPVIPEPTPEPAPLVEPEPVAPAVPTGTELPPQPAAVPPEPAPPVAPPKPTPPVAPPPVDDSDLDVEEMLSREAEARRGF